MTSEVERTLIRSKLMVPHVAGLLHRPRVCEAVARGLERKLTLVTAPAGYGKTTALVDFAEGCPVPVCWYTVDERDRDAGLFASYLVEAIRARFSGFGGRTLALLASETGAISRDPAGAAEVLAAEILDLETPFALVIDNYEPLDGWPGIRQFLGRLLDVLPCNCHLMVGSRVVPGIPLSHLEEGDQVVEVKTPDLSFTPQEVRALLGAVHVNVSEEQAAAISVNSEGWITAVLLAGLFGGDVEEILSGGKGTEEMYEYLAAEVLERQPPVVQTFLLDSSVLREMTVSLCDAVLEIGNAGEMLQEVERRNLFVTRFGEGGRVTYRYHHLFRGFLEGCLAEQAGGLREELHLRAARWFDRANDVEESVHHYLAAEAYPEAAALMERAAREWFVRGRVETLLGWVERLPDLFRAQAPRLLLYQSTTLTDRYDFDGARQALAHAEAGFRVRGEHVANLSRIYSQHALMYLFEGRYEKAIKHAQMALEVLSSEDTIEKSHAQRYIGMAYVGLGRLDEGVAMLEDVLALYREFGSPYDIANSLMDLGDALATLGHLGEAASRFSEALAIVRRLGAAVPLAMTLNDLGYIRHLRGEYQETLALYEESLAIARREAHPRNQAYVVVGMADLYRDIGLYERAGSLYDAGWRFAKEAKPSFAIYVLLVQADMCRWQGDLAQACAILQRARRLAEEKEQSFEIQGRLPVAEGIALAESGEVDAGLQMISSGIAFLEQHQARGELVRAYFLLSKARYLTGDEEGCLAALRDALCLAQEVGSDQSIVAEGQHVEEMLKLGVSRGVDGCRGIMQKVHALRQLDLESVRGGEEVEKGHLRIYAFGGGQVVLGERTLTPADWRAAMARELFFYILLNGPVGRDAIGEVFWPGMAADRMESNFHTTLHRLRRAVGATAVVAEDGAYRVGDISYWFDVDEFETLVGHARALPPKDWQAEDMWRRALVLYGGDFLPEVDGEWCMSKRERLCEMYVDALVGVGRCREVKVDYEGALEWYRQALGVDDLREDVHLRVMACYDKMGQRSRALQQYRHCSEVLDRELGIRPSPKMARVYERIAGGG